VPRRNHCCRCIREVSISAHPEVDRACAAGPFKEKIGLNRVGGFDDHRWEAPLQPTSSVAWWLTPYSPRAEPVWLPMILTLSRG
jgi:hypothetical protein